MYDRIEIELRGVQQALHYSRTVPTTPPPPKELDLGDEPAQLRKIADVTKACRCCMKEEKEQATMDLKQAQEEIIEQRRVAQQEKDNLQTKFEENKAQIQQEKEKLCAEQVRVKKVVNKELRSMAVLEQMEEDPVVNQVMKIVEAI
jgi:septal ring factor EnvC (AmiA/AmiB activator)